MPAKSRSRARVWLALGLIAVLLGVIALLTWRATIGQVQRELDPALAFPASASTPVDTPEAKAKAARTSAAPAVPEPIAAESESIARGQVLDDLFDFPVFAKIAPDVGSCVFSNPESGKFLLSRDSAGWNSLVASAEGFEDALVEAKNLKDARSIEIRMRFARNASVSVRFEDGTPAMRVRVTWRAAAEIPARIDPEGWIDSRIPSPSETVETKTGLDGVARAALPSHGVAIVEDPRNKRTKTVSILPGQDIAVVLPDTAVTLRFVEHNTRRPIEGLEIDAWSPREIDAMTEMLTTDDVGDVTIIPTSFPILVRRHGSVAYQSQLIPLSTGLSKGDPRRESFSVISVDAPSAEPMLIGVRPSAVRVHLVDQGTGAPIESSVRIQERPVRVPPAKPLTPDGFSVSSPRTGTALSEIFFQRDGVLELPVYLREPEKLVRGEKVVWKDGVLVRYELVFTAAGYRTFRVLAPSDVVSEFDDAPIFKLTPEISRSVRIVYENGGPYSSDMYVYSPSEEVTCLASGGVPSGIYGPFDWPGGPLTICTGLQLNKRMHWTISEAELSSQNVVTFKMPFPWSSIIVEDIPERASRVPLIACAGGLEYPPTGIELGKRRFDFLLTDAYLVGPIDWVRGAAPQTMPMGEDGDPPAGNVALRTFVKPGETAVVKWREEWDSERVIEGRVRVLGAGRLEPFLVPLFGSEKVEDENGPPKTPRMDFDRRSPRILLDGDGKYRIGMSEPLPALLAICLADPTDWASVRGLHVIETIKPGESADIPTGSVELTWKEDPWSAPVQVFYDLPGQSLRHPVSTPNASCEYLWPTERVLRLDGIPLRVEQLAITFRVQPIQLEEGKLVRIEVELSKLARDKVRRGKRR